MEPAGVVVGGGGVDVQRTSSANLRDLLRMDVERTNSVILLDLLRSKQEDSCRNINCGSGAVGVGVGGGGSCSNSSNIQSLGSVLSLTKNTISNEKSVLDVIEDNPRGSTTAVLVPDPDVSVNPNSVRVSLSELLQRNGSEALDRGSSIWNNTVGNGGEEVVEERGGESSSGVGEPVRMSLMALLAETESAYIVNESEVEEDEGKEGEEEVVKVVEYNGCCVCMVRKKGAAFIPCGHTFCRLCSRELYVQRGHCPLCNNLILEILDIF